MSDAFSVVLANRIVSNCVGQSDCNTISVSSVGSNSSSCPTGQKRNQREAFAFQNRPVLYSPIRSLRRRHKQESKQENPVWRLPSFSKFLLESDHWMDAILTKARLLTISRIVHWVFFGLSSSSCYFWRVPSICLFILRSSGSMPEKHVEFTSASLYNQRKILIKTITIKKGHIWLSFGAFESDEPDELQRLSSYLY